MARDEFQGQSGGGGLTDFTFEITDAYFGYSEALNEKAGREIMLLHLIGKTDSEDQPILEHDGFHPSYQLADGWVTNDGGKTVIYTGTRTKPRLGSWYGRFIDDVLEMTEDIAGTDEDPLGGEADPKTASTWIGTKFRFEEKEYDWGGEFGKSNKLMPVEYLGRFNAAEASTPSPADNGSLRASVEALAKSSPDYATFQAAALALPGISDDTALLTEVAREDGIYASVRGS